jgi:hypothetical protein
MSVPSTESLWTPIAPWKSGGSKVYRATVWRLYVMWVVQSPEAPGRL